MKKLIIPALAFTIVQNAAFAAPSSATGPTALALAAVIAPHSPSVRAFDKRVIARLFRGNTSFGFTPNKKISGDADSVVCRVSNVDITSRRRAQLRIAETNPDRARSQRSRRNHGGCRCSRRGSRRLKYRKRHQIAVHDRPERDHAEGGRRRGLQFRNGAVAVFVHLKRNTSCG